MRPYQVLDDLLMSLVVLALHVTVCADTNTANDELCLGKYVHFTTEL